MAQPTRTRRILKLALLNAAVFMLVVVIVEAVDDLVLLSQKGFGPSRRTGYLHLQYDAKLGWNTIPNLIIKDHYGPGIDVRINSQGLREDIDLSIEVPAGKVRVLCVGNSFTFGDGVNASNCPRPGGSSMINFGLKS